MTLKEVAVLLNARIIHENGHLDKVIRHAFAADLMSDVQRNAAYHGTCQPASHPDGGNVRYLLCSVRSGKTSLPRHDRLGKRM